MIGATLEEIRTHIENLASGTGDYYLVCARYGDRPVPAASLRFESRPVARAAARATEQYRTALRRYDPQLPYYDVIVCQETDVSERSDEHTARTTDTDSSADEWSLSEPVLDASASDRQRLVEFCHRVAAAVFETLSEHACEGVESAIMDAYFELAETVTDPDELCLRLLESMASELDQKLSPAEQADVLAAAAARLPTLERPDRPITAAMTALEDRGLLDCATQLLPETPSDGSRLVELRLSGYALSPQDDRLPVLPIVLALYRRQPDWLRSSVEVVESGDGWHITLIRAGGSPPSGLTSAPIRSEL